MSDYRKVSRHRVLALSEIVDGDNRHGEDQKTETD
jgi:hypothetical protein